VDIAEELQFEATKRAGSPEGFAALIRLILDSVMKEVVAEPTIFTPSGPTGDGVRPEWLWPEQYMPVFHEYVALRQQQHELEMARYTVQEQYRQQVSLDLEDVTKRANKKIKELPIHAYKRLLSLEDRFKIALGGIHKMYEPRRWSEISERVEYHISDWGVARHERKLDEAHYNRSLLSEGMRLGRTLGGS
jgi:hypothetical protein